MASEENKNWFQRHKVWSVIIALLVFFFLLGVLVPQPNTESNSNTQQNSAVEKQTVLALTGSGSKQSEKFTVKDAWDLEWNYDCSKFGQQGNFIVTVYNPDGSASTQNSMINQLGMSGKDVQHYQKDGTFYLSVNSVCDWHITVKD